MNIFESKVTSHEEVDFDNQRLMYVGDIVDVNIHNYENEIKLSTDEVISLFDAGYRFGLIEQLDSLRKNSEKLQHEMETELKQFHDELRLLRDLLSENQVDINISTTLISSLEKIEKTVKNYQSQIESNVMKKFDICQYSNEKRVRNQDVKSNGKKFIQLLLKSFPRINNSWSLF